MADALSQIAKQTQDGKVYVKVPAYQFKGLHAKLGLWGSLGSVALTGKKMIVQATNGGQNCGTDDGACCWTACCG